MKRYLVHVAVFTAVKGRIRKIPRNIATSIFVSMHMFLFLILALTVPGCAVAQRAIHNNEAVVSQSPAPTGSPTQQPQSDAIDRATSKPYSGSLSQFEDANRAEKLQVDRVMDLLGIKEGSNVADIGAGSGWFTVRAARRVGNRGSVYAVEINSDFLKHIEKRAKDEHLDNIRAILGKPDDPLLPEGSVNAVLLLKTYHEVAEPVRLLRRIRAAIRPGGLLGIIDREGKGDDHGIDKAVVVTEAARAGFALVDTYDFVKRDNVDYFLIFK